VNTSMGMESTREWRSTVGGGGRSCLQRGACEQHGRQGARAAYSIVTRWLGYGAGGGQTREMTEWMLLQHL
jgi:hypothetical protein